MTDSEGKPFDPQVLAVITAAIAAALEHHGGKSGFRVVSIDQAKAEGMG